MGAEPPVGTRRKKEKPDAEEDVEKKTRTVTQLQKELVDLKAALALAEAGQKKAKERRDSKKEKGRRRDDAEVEAPKRRKKEHLPFERGGLLDPEGVVTLVMMPQIGVDLETHQEKKTQI